MITVEPGDPRYDSLTSGLNQRYAAKPARVELVRGTEDVVAAVQLAVSNEERLSVRSGGHCFEDFVFNPDVEVVVDLSAMTGVYFDTSQNAYVVEAGARLADVYEELYRGWDVTLPGGICYSVGAGGHITGGGYGLLSRTHGLTVDHLDAVEVVVVDADGTARAVVATRGSDLWWAHTGGGGGNFGVVTRFFFRPLVRPPSEVLLSSLSVPWSRLDEAGFARLLDGYGRWHAESRSGLSSLLTLNHVSNGSAGLVTQIDADEPEAAQVLDEYLSMLLGDVFEPPRRLPWLRATRYLGTSSPVLNDPTLRGEHKSAYVRAPLPPEQIALAYRELTRPDVTNPNAMLVAFSYGGAIGSVASDATAVAQRDSIFKLLYQSFWSTEDGDAANIGWVRDFFRSMYASTGGVPVSNSFTDGCYVNYPDADLSSSDWNSSGVPWHALYYKDNYPRLQAVKARWDPLNVFRHAQSIQAAGPNHCSSAVSGS
ncbi:FAD-binding oxidoreductase [Amycolatopsis sp. NPDC059657]|uniref:FAD-binding oxidoreductase n=1 Tax=Amycolatopsis sp. NPDC059657 TaxID=3346899 RepID=UPI0036725023